MELLDPCCLDRFRLCGKKKVASLFFFCVWVVAMESLPIVDTSNESNHKDKSDPASGPWLFYHFTIMPIFV